MGGLPGLSTRKETGSSCGSLQNQRNNITAKSKMKQKMIEYQINISLQPQTAQTTKKYPKVLKLLKV